MKLAKKSISKADKALQSISLDEWLKLQEEQPELHKKLIAIKEIVSNVDFLLND